MQSYSSAVNPSAVTPQYYPNDTSYLANPGYGSESFYNQNYNQAYVLDAPAIGMVYQWPEAM
jgi:hypothetical protein